ncbi:MAG: hypothetical protein ACRDF4_09080, partial [Rhabdochlamydiaceae bacterium]
YNRVQESLRPKGTHCSDLVLCVRQSAFRQLDPKTPSLATFGFYVDGNTSDRNLKNLFVPSSPENIRGIWITPDALDEEGNIWEFKATRSNSGLSSHFGKQLAYYLALSGVKKGFLLVRRLNRKYPKKGEPDTWHPFEIYSLEMTPELKHQTIDEIQVRMMALELALEEKNPMLAPDVITDPDLNWLCQSCLWKEPCWSKARGTSVS